MSVPITSVRPATMDEWTSVWRGCEYATYFHSPEWAEIWNVYTKSRMHPNPKLIVFSDGKEALLPLSSEKNYKGLTTTYWSSPGGTFGGWISTDVLSAAHAASLGDYFIRKLGNLFWRMNPYDKFAFKAGVRISKEETTQALDLTGGFDAVYKSWTKGHRSAARKASKAGVSVRLASSLDDWHAYYSLYEDSMRRWGSEVSHGHGQEIFDEMFRRDSPQIKLWIALYQDEIVAGALCFYGTNHVVYWHGAASEVYFHLRPVNLLMYESIKQACEQGYVWFDFNPSGELKGVKAFKKSFGTQELRCPEVNVRRSWSKVVGKAASITRGRVS